MAVEKLLPQNVEAEAGVLGSILIDQEALTLVASVLTPEDFYREAHRLIYTAACDLYEAGEPADLITLTDELARQGKLDEIGGASYVSSLANQIPTSRNAVHYARIVARCATLRRLINAAGQIAAVAYNEPDGVDALENAKQLILDVERGVAGEGRAFAQVLDDLAEDVLTRLDADEFIGTRTGFAQLDSHMIGIEPGELVYLCGRPGSGKSALGLRIALNAALDCARTRTGSVDVITLEMSARAQARRLVSDEAHINTRHVRSGFRMFAHSRDVDMDAYQRFEEARQKLRGDVGHTLYVRDGVVSIAQLRAHVTRAVMERGCKLVVIDQLDLMADREKDEFTRITRMSRALKQIAISCHVAILCLCQLNREVEKRTNKRPMLSDLRQSGQLEQDADIVLGIYRPAYYDTANQDEQFQQFVELLVLKARDGESGAMVPLQFVREFTRFRDWPHATIPADPSRNVKSES